MPHTPKVYSEEEIDLLLKNSNSNRGIDSLLLHSINGLIAAIVPHIQMVSEMGTPETVRARTAWIDTQIARQQKRGKILDKVLTSSLLWALPVFILVLFVLAGETLVDAARHLLSRRMGG